MSHKGCRNRGSLTALISLLGLVSILTPGSGLAATVTLAWDPSPDPDLSGYKLYYGAATGTYTNSIQVGNATTATVSNLTGGVTYYFAATALNSIALESVFSAETSYTTLLPVNQQPTLNTLANLTINEGAAAQTVNLSGISSGSASEPQTLVVTASSSNTGLIPNPNVTYNSPAASGSISFTPVALASGSATITVTVNDGGDSNNIVTRTFNIAVNSVNQSPTLNALSNISINEGSGVQTVNLSGITTGAANESQSLAVTASSSNTGLIPSPTVNYTSPNATGSISFTPVAGTGGTATITVTVNDGGASNNFVTRTFTATVNRLPTITAIANQVIGVNQATTSLPFTIGDAESTASSLTITAGSSNTALVPNNRIALGGTGANRTVTVTPLTGQTGFANITITVSDGNASDARTFQVSVQPKPAPPGNLQIVAASP